MDWTPIVASLLGSVSPATSIIGLLNNVMTLVNHITKDDPAGQLVARRNFLKMLDDYSTKVKEAPDGTDVSKIIIDFTALFNSK